MIKIRVGQVVRPKHLSVVANRQPPGPLVRMDVFTGWIPANWHTSGAPTRREVLKSFLMNEARDIVEIPEQDLLDFTVTASVSSVGDEDDEANVAAVDEATIRVEPQSLTTQAGNPDCLVLVANLSTLNATIHGITYQVTTLSSISPDTGPALKFILDSDPNWVPA